jgi:hypothetical protein
MELVYVCSPYRGDVKRNKEYARTIAKSVIEGGCVPIVPHLYITEVLNDENPADREQGLAMCLELVERCNFMFVGQRYGITEGMKQEIAKAKLCNKMIVYMG